jgi:hypothetical protein
MGHLSPGAGVDGVKVDCQSTLDMIGSSLGGGPALAAGYHAALEDSVATHFPGNACINCMCHSTSDLYRHAPPFVYYPASDAAFGTSVYASPHEICSKRRQPMLKNAAHAPAVRNRCCHVHGVAAIWGPAFFLHPAYLWAWRAIGMLGMEALNRHRQDV